MKTIKKYYKITSEFKVTGKDSISIGNTVLKNMEYILDWGSEGEGVAVSAGNVVAYIEESVAEKKGIKIDKTKKAIIS